METVNVNLLGNGNETKHLEYELDLEYNSAPHLTPLEGPLSESTSDVLLGTNNQQNGNMHQDEPKQNNILHYKLTLDSFLVTKLLMKTDLPKSASIVCPP
jgi:hypothetical protein